MGFFSGTPSAKTVVLDPFSGKREAELINEVAELRSKLLGKEIDNKALIRVIKDFAESGQIDYEEAKTTYQQYCAEYLSDAGY